MSTAGSSGDAPAYTFVESDTFRDAKGSLPLAARIFDEHLWAIQDMLLDGPFRWSVEVPGRPGLRLAVSDATPYSRTAIRVLFRIAGEVIELLDADLR